MSIDGGSVMGRMSYEILPIEVTSEPQRSAAESSVSLAHTSFLLRQRYVSNANVVFREIKNKTKHAI